MAFLDLENEYPKVTDISIPAGICPVCVQTKPLPIWFMSANIKISTCSAECWNAAFANIYGSLEDPEPIEYGRAPGDQCDHCEMPFFNPAGVTSVHGFIVCGDRCRLGILKEIEKGRNSEAARIERKRVAAATVAKIFRNFQDPTKKAIRGISFDFYAALIELAG